VDQPGAGTSKNLLGAALPAAGWVGNASEPFYVWNNKLGGATNNKVTASTNVQSGRDYFNDGRARPGYAPYVYPHPLNSGP
jgi:hypothetical protein